MQDIIQQMFKTASKYVRLSKISNLGKRTHTRFYALKAAPESKTFTAEDIDKLTKHAEKNSVPADILNQLPNLVGEKLYHDRYIYGHKYVVNNKFESSSPVENTGALAAVGLFGLFVIETANSFRIMELPLSTFVALYYPVFAIVPARVYLDNQKLEFLRGRKQPFWRNFILDDIKLPKEH